MEKIKRFIECLLPVTACNLMCDYCYVIQENNRKNEIPKLNYTPQQIRSALTVERLGGICYISICGAGETLLPKYSVDIVHELLQEGHFVNITTNGTLTQRFEEFCSFEPNLLSHLHFAFSLHFIELKDKGLLQTFFDNVKRVRQAGCSFVVQINLYDGYLPYLDEIKRLCLDNLGALPQVAATRDESNSNFVLLTNLSKENYAMNGDSFDSPLFTFTMENFMVKRKEFCYAGDWSFLLNLQTGIMRKCYANGDNPVNIFENPNDPIPFCAVGKNCKNKYCVNSSHFMSLGVIPSKNVPSYAQLRNRESANWYTPTMNSFLNGKLEASNKKYSLMKKLRIYTPLRIKNFFQATKIRISRLTPNSIKSIYKKLRKK
ncbi:MAG: radical SAM protein [Clostridia bacterium]|nr:radical SAM protein [Clostridia bacterium]